MSDSKDKTMAIIKGPVFGVGDRGTVALTFSTHTSEMHAALQVFNAEKGAEIIQKYGVSSVEKLEGKPCWVDTSKRGLITWIGPCVIR